MPTLKLHLSYKPISPCQMLVGAMLLWLLIGIEDKYMAEAVLKCYKCSVTVEKYVIKNRTIITPLCAKFERTEDFIVDCPYSTMCLKTISTLHLNNGQKLETVTRGCAQQKNTTQVFRNRQWEQQHSVQEVYQEGCEQVKGNNLAGSTNTHCYCRGNMCNSSNLADANYVILMLMYAYNFGRWFP